MNVICVRMATPSRTLIWNSKVPKIHPRPARRVGGFNPSGLHGPKPHYVIVLGQQAFNGLNGSVSHQWLID